MDIAFADLLGGGGLASNVFQEVVRCYSLAMCGRTELDAGGKSAWRRGGVVRVAGGGARAVARASRARSGRGHMWSQ